MPNLAMYASVIVCSSLRIKDAQPPHQPIEHGIGDILAHAAQLHQAVTVAILRQIGNARVKGAFGAIGTVGRAIDRDLAGAHSFQAE